MAFLASALFLLLGEPQGLFSYRCGLEHWQEKVPAPKLGGL